MKYITPPLLLGLTAGPAFASEGGPFFSMSNPNFVILLSFLVFIGVLVYLKVPGLIGGLLDKRADDIKTEIDEARALRDEAQTILASYERKQKDVQVQADNIVETAKNEAKLAAEQAKVDLKDAIARRLQAAEDQIASAEASAIKEVRDTAITVATKVAGEVIAAKMTAKDAGEMVDAAIKDVSAKLH
ncbi:MAG: F0F1 ATP synthase subunit B [Rhodobacterales bacterium]